MPFAVRLKLLTKLPKSTSGQPTVFPRMKMSTTHAKVPAAAEPMIPGVWADEQCVLVDHDDHVIGSASKIACHLRTNIENRGLLHRAFSVFLFDSTSKSESRLLMQSRAATKPTFADYYTNTCCSHPLMHVQPDEVESRHNMHAGIKRAARRRLEQELGLKDFPLHKLHLVNKVHYKSVDYSSQNVAYGEHEIDYILLGVMPKNSPSMTPNPAEVSWCGWMNQQEIRDMLKNHNIKVSPWFRCVADKWLFDWWQHLDKLPELEHVYDQAIFRAGDLLSNHDVDDRMQSVV